MDEPERPLRDHSRGGGGCGEGRGPLRSPLGRSLLRDHSRGESGCGAGWRPLRSPLRCPARLWTRNELIVPCTVDVGQGGDPCSRLWTGPSHLLREEMCRGERVGALLPHVRLSTHHAVASSWWRMLVEYIPANAVPLHPGVNLSAHRNRLTGTQAGDRAGKRMVRYMLTTYQGETV